MGVEFQIMIDNEGGVVRAGEHLRGSILAIVDQGPIQLQGSLLEVTLLGEERTNFIVTDPEGSNGPKWKSDSRSFIEIKIPVSEDPFLQEHKDNQGQYGGSGKVAIYHIPFDMELLDSLPSSMRYLKHQYGGVEILYMIKVGLRKPKDRWLAYTKVKYVTLQSRAFLAERDPLPYHAEPVHEIVKIGCKRPWNVDSVSLGAHLDDTNLTKGQKYSINVSCPKGLSVKVLILQELSWQVDSRSCHDTHTLAEVNFTNSLTCPRRSVSFLIPRNGNWNYWNAQPLCTFSGELLTIKHFVQLRLMTDGLCVRDPIVTIPIVIGEAPPADTFKAASNVREHLETSMPNHSPVCKGAMKSSVMYFPTSPACMTGTTVDENHCAEPDVMLVEAMVVSDNALGQKQPPSLELLLQKMAQSGATCDMIQTTVNDPEWNGIYTSLTPAQFAIILENMDPELDERRSAAAIAQTMQQGQLFTCAYVVAAVQAAEEWNRAAMVVKLIPYCSDLVEHHSVILSELTDSEKLVTEQVFANALQNGERKPQLPTPPKQQQLSTPTTGQRPMLHRLLSLPMVFSKPRGQK